MKICMLTSMHPPEDGRIFHKEASSLAKKYEVSLIAPDYSSKKYNAKGVAFTTVNKTKSRIFHFVTLFRLYQAALKEDADIYHCHEPDALLICLLLKKNRSIKIVYDVHEHWPSMAALTAFGSLGPRIVRCRSIHSFIQHMTEYFELKLAKKADIIITVSDSVADRFSRVGLNTSNIMNVPIITQEIQDVITKDLNDIVYVCGKLGFSKGVDIALKTLGTLAKEYSSVHLTLIGNVSSDIFEDIDVDLKERVEITGFLPYEEMYRKISESGIGLILFENTHYNSYIGLPNKLFDYMTCGLPVVASDFPEIRKVINISECGILVDTGDVNSIVEGVKYLLDNPKEAQEMGVKGRMAIHTIYNWDIMEERLFDLYGDLVI